MFHAFAPYATAPYSTALYALAALSLVLAVALYRIIMSPNLRYHSFLYKVKAAIIFRCGKIRRLHAAPWVTWDGKEEREIDLKDVREAQRFVKAGDIGLHNDWGFACNLAIPGNFKHAWIFTGGDQIIEAVQEGVLKRDAMYPLISDYVVILRPMGVTHEEVREAVSRAESIVGSDYDANFDFDLDDEEKKFSTNLRCSKFHGAFSCTETVAFSWLRCRDKLGIFRTKHAGREAIIADDYLRMHFEVVWASPSVTPKWLEENGMHEEGRLKIGKFLERGKA